MELDVCSRIKYSDHMPICEREKASDQQWQFLDHLCRDLSESILSNLESPHDAVISSIEELPSNQRAVSKLQGWDYSTKTLINHVLSMSTSELCTGAVLTPHTLFKLAETLSDPCIAQMLEEMNAVIGKLALLNEPLIHAMTAKDSRMRQIYGAELDQEGMVALLHAIRCFKGVNGIRTNDSFVSFACGRIKQAIRVLTNKYRSNASVPQRDIDLACSYKKAISNGQTCDDFKKSFKVSDDLLSVIKSGKVTMATRTDALSSEKGERTTTWEASETCISKNTSQSITREINRRFAMLNDFERAILLRVAGIKGQERSTLVVLADDLGRPVKSVSGALHRAIGKLGFKGELDEEWINLLS
ncbi:hypothetical protein [Enterovibrio norvegicus]|uniref:hypothetical protein n=1 Tax=Enterovibrio norvegicus TaxID=188144 RepID=UPI00352CFF4D